MPQARIAEMLNVKEATSRGIEVKVLHKPSAIALDGKGDIAVEASDQVKVRLQRDGPPVVDVEKTIREAVKKGFFRN